MSLIVQKNQVNKLAVTVTEKTNFDNVNYIMSLYSNEDIDTKIVKFTGDTSTNPTRINYFNLFEVPLVDEDLLNARINLNVGTYDYIIYATFSTGNTLNGASPVESGMLTVKGPITSDVVFSGSSNIVTFK